MKHGTIQSTCKNCLKEFSARVDSVKVGYGKFCSHSCSSSLSSFKHGEATVGKKSKEYYAWIHAKRRTTDPKYTSYSRYGGRGIKVCARWLNSFESFLEDMGRAPSPQHSLDRMNNDGNYEPNNCRWATPRQQMQNTSTNRMITYKGETMCLVEWGRRIGISGDAVTRRFERGWSLKKALTMPPQRPL